MSKKKSANYSQNLVDALNKLPSPIYDERHDLTVYLDNNKARSNQSRFQHICSTRHKLSVKDIQNIPEGIQKNSTLKKDKNKKNTFNYYFKRKSNKGEYIKISVSVDEELPKSVKIKTIFITKVMK